MQNRLTLTFLSALLPLLTSASTGLPQERHLKDSDLRKLGEALGDYIDSRVNDKGVGAAESDVYSAMDKLEKKLTKASGSGDILASAKDMGHAIWMSYEYSRQRVTKGKVKADSYVGSIFSKSNPLNYAVWAPSKYSAKSGPYILIISIPDEGEDVQEHITNDWTHTDIRASAIIASPEMPSDKDAWSQREGIARTLVLMKAIYEQYAVDFDKIFLVGEGLGVSAAVSIANMFPDRFAGLIGRSGDAGKTAPDNFMNMPTMFAGGGAEVSAFQEACNDLGFDNCKVNAEAQEPEIWEWIKATTRQSYPQEVLLVPGAPFPKRAYWLEVQPTDGATGRIEAKVDRETNTITVEGQGVTAITLHFNDVILDMTRPVKVIANGQEHLDAIPRSRRWLLNSLFKSSCDPGRVFVNSKTYHLPSLKGETDGE